MTYAAQEARQELLDAVAEAVDELAGALAALEAAYDGLDELTADRMEEELFRPVQAAFGRAQRTHAGFAARSGLPERTFAPAEPGRPSRGVRAFLEDAADAVRSVDERLAELQDSMRPVEIGDAELRAGLAEVRSLVADSAERAERFVARFGR